MAGLATLGRYLTSPTLQDQRNLSSWCALLEAVEVLEAVEEAGQSKGIPLNGRILAWRPRIARILLVAVVVVEDREQRVVV